MFIINETANEYVVCKKEDIEKIILEFTFPLPKKEDILQTNEKCSRWLNTDKICFFYDYESVVKVYGEIENNYKSTFNRVIM